MINSSGVSLWRDGYEPIWRQNGVWDVDRSGRPHLLQPDYFASVGDRPVDFGRDYFNPFVRRYRQAVQDIDPESLVFVTPPPSELASGRIDFGPLPGTGWVYAPHWAVAKYDGEWVEFPEYTDACYEDPSWGMNKDMAYDCGKPFGWIKKVGWKAGEKKWPGAYRAVRNFKIDNAQMSQMIVEVDLEGKSVDETVAKWMRENESTWKGWIK